VGARKKPLNQANTFKPDDLGYKMRWSMGKFPGFYAVLGKIIKMGPEASFRHKGYEIFRVRQVGAPVSEWHKKYLRRYYKPMGRMDDMASLMRKE
jgi:hypothetical protein